MPRIFRYGAMSASLFLLLGLPCGAQTTQGIILGRITDSVTGRPIAASVLCLNEATTASVAATADISGNYAVGSLSPGRYRVTISAPQYQSQQARSLDLPVSGRVELNFRLRPLSDVWEAGQYRSWRLPESQQTLGYYGPDVDTSRVAIFNANQGYVTPLDVSLSDVISPIEIENLPLIGRDVYTMLLLIPGVTSDTATARGLGFSVDGQRPSSSNYLLDGVENNNLLVTGPLSAATPEFVQEYRISTANYSAEYGRTSGFIANAITHSGTNQWHGSAFAFGETKLLNANGFQENAQGFDRPAFTEIQPGAVISGPLLRNRLFLFGGFETLLSHGSGDPQTFALPTRSFIDSTSSDSYAGQILRKFLPETVPDGTGSVGLATIGPPTSLDRTDTLLRLDYAASQRHQFFARAALDVLNQHNLLSSPYPDFSAHFRQRSLSIAAGVISRLGASSENEFRVGRGEDSVRVDTPNSEVPTLVIDTQFQVGDQFYPVAMPGKTNAFDYRNAGRNIELLDNWSRFMGRHSLKAGGGFLQRDIDLNVSVYPEGYLQFNTLEGFAQSQLVNLQAQFDQLSDNHDPVSPGRSYRYRQFDGFVQDSFHISNRLTIDYGLRYEFYGSPLNVGAQKDYLIQLGGGPTIEDSIMNARATLPSSSGNQVIYSSRPSNWAIRYGIAWDPTGRGRTVVRASYGIFYDRLFDNLWNNVIQNRYGTGDWTFSQPVSLGVPLAQLEAAGQYQSFTEVIPALAFQPNLRAPRTQSAFAGVQQSLGRGINLEVHAQASRSRQLITTDEVNRPFSVTPSESNLDGYLNPAIANYINYRANQGSADYSALVTAVRFQRARFTGQVSYTWSHSIDNQSEPLAGTFFDFNTFHAAQTSGSPFISSFTQQFASSLDRGNSDFDQRQNLVFFFTYRPRFFSGATKVGALLRDWTLSSLGAVRSGLPFTVYAEANYTAAIPEYLINQRADLTLPGQAYISEPANGGRLLLNTSAFANPGPNVIGTSGRNEFFGPGLFNTDISVARSFALPKLAESARITVRADFYNFFNHANLNNPESFYGAADFGVALFGRSEVNNGFTLLEPLTETARQTQILLRLEF
jgi:hypothetical protein